MPIHQLLRQRPGSAPRVGTINGSVHIPSGLSSSSGSGIGGAANGGVGAHTPPVTAGAAGGWERERQAACHRLALDDALRSRASAGNAIADRTQGGLPGVCRGVAGVVSRSPPSGWHMQQEGTRSSSVGCDPNSERSERALSAAKSGFLQRHQADARATSAFSSTSSTSPEFTRIGRHREQTPRLPTSWASAPLSPLDRSCLSPASSASSLLLSNSLGFSQSAALGGRERELYLPDRLLAAHPDHWLHVLAGLQVPSHAHSSTVPHLSLLVRRPGSATCLQPPSFSASALAPWSAQAQWRGLSASSRAQQQHQQQAAQPGRAQGAAGKASGASAAPPQGSKVEDLAEECDEAVEDLGEVKARVLAAREAMRKGQGVLKASLLVVAAVFQRLWQMVAAVRHVTVVLQWSRQDWLDTFAGWWRVIKHGAHHYWVGTKLLWADVRISSRLLLKTAKGQSLTRRERQQLMRTSADIFRLVPFAVFVIVPFMEFLLPVALRLFPNMLPSTFQDKSEEEAKLKRLLKARLQMARFLQDTVGEMAKEVKGRRSGEIKKNAEELAKFMAKVRTGGRVSNEEILAFASLFNDELTLDNMTRPRLVNMCKYMGLQPFGTDAYLTYILRAKLAWIKEDDKLIQSEGVDSLSEQELRAACRERGMLGVLSVEEMRQQLRDWLDLSLNRSVPSSLLILSRSFLVAGKVRPEEAVQATLSSLPKKVLESVEASVPSGDETSERQRKLDLLKEQEKLIKEEAQEAERLRKAEEAARRDRALEEMRPAMGDSSSTATTAGATAAAAAAAAAAAEAAQAARPFAEAEAAMGLSAMNGQDMAQQRARANRDQLCQLSAALAVLASSSAVSTERVDFLRLVNREIELYNRMVEETGKEGEEQARVAYEAAREASEKAASDEQGVSEALINKVDTMLQRLEKELDAVDAKIGSKLRILDTDYDGKVTPEELAAAAALLRSTLGHGEVAELVGSLAKDKDGKILVEDIVRLGLLEPSETEDDEQPEQQQKQQKQVQETAK